jgi:hypothetical protein
LRLFSVTDEDSRRRLFRVRPGHFTAERQAVGESPENVPKHVLDLPGLFNEIANRQRVRVGERYDSDEVDERQAQPNLPPEWSQNGSVSATREKFRAGDSSNPIGLTLAALLR